MFKKKGRQKRLPAGGKRKRPFSSVPVIISSIAPAASASTMAMNQASLAAVEHPPPGASATSTSSATSTADLSMDQAWNAALLNSTSSMWLPSSHSLLFPPVPPTVPNAPLYNAEHSLEKPSCLNCQQHQAAISVLRQQLQIAQRPCTECKRYRELALAPCTECPKLERLITVGNTRKRNQVNHDMDKGQPETTGLQAQVDELKAKLRKMDEELAVAQVTVVIQQEEIQRMRAEAGAAALA
ncbi:hypothetical protein BCR44DRAFT_69562 [Catenaria anguillulae PL171]|uniref:Uncharacterized protein n=1 Tax=Catenaria anguillulae PL171 TaxID=765915 RepID=A0A1Y2HN99_9FUNG|nr:hypothetical protein BCR44DRAFT_69562 [Catenaria anguillulae PL171]